MQHTNLSKNFPCEPSHMAAKLFSLVLKRPNLSRTKPGTITVGTLASFFRENVVLHPAKVKMKKNTLKSSPGHHQGPNVNMGQQLPSFSFLSQFRFAQLPLWMTLIKSFALHELAESAGDEQKCSTPHRRTPESFFQELTMSKWTLKS